MEQVLIFLFLLSASCIPETSITKLTQINTNEGISIIGGYPNNYNRNFFALADAQVIFSQGSIYIYKQSTNNYEKISKEALNINEFRINLPDDYQIFGLIQKEAQLKSYKISDDKFTLLKEVQFDSTPGCFHFLSPTKIIAALINGQIITINWDSKEKTTIVKNTLNFENCFFRGMSSEESILLMHGTSVYQVNIPDKVITVLIENINFSDVTTFGWLSTFALYDYINNKIQIYNKYGNLVREASSVSSSLGKETIIRRWSFSTDKGQNSFLVLSSQTTPPTIFIYYYYDKMEEIENFRIQDQGKVSFLLPSSRGIENNYKETELHVGMDSGQFYVLKFQLVSEIIENNDDSGFDTLSFLIWFFLGFSIITIIIVCIFWKSICKKKCCRCRCNLGNIGWSSNNNDYDGDCNGGGDNGGGDCCDGGGDGDGGD